MIASETFDLERRLVASLAVDATDVQRSIAEGLTANDFANAEARAIFRAICRIAVQKDPLDPDTIYRNMAGLTGEACPDPRELANILIVEGTSLRRRSLTADVIALAKRRRLRAALGQAIELVDLPTQTWDETWDAVSPFLSEAQKIDGGSSKRTRAEILAEARKILGPKENVGLNGPFRAWDIDARKLRPGELCVLAARPGVGKSALALQYASACVADGKCAAYFSLEMSEEEQLARLAVQTGRSAREEDALKQLDKVAGQAYAFYEVGDSRSLPQIEARARLCCGTRPVGVIIVDYLQLVTPPPETRKDQRERQVAEMSRRFKMLAGELRVPVILLAQLNREMEKDGNRRPRLSDLRESGSIEQDADAVWFLHQQDSKGTANGDLETVEVHLIQAKRRNWQPGIFMKLGFQRNIVTFNPMQQ